MEKYLLMYCQEREMSVKGVFDTPVAAHQAMEADFNKFHLEDLRLEKADFDEQIECDACEITDTHAWSNLGRVNVDWRIVKIEI